MDTFELRTKERNQLVDITDRVRQTLKRGGLRQGACVVY
jgi:thiamine phosphate synthase YjbQ (UPF0047 family)